MKPIKVFKTHTFKLHKISKRKAAMINKTMTQAEYAFFHGLKVIKPLALALLGKEKKERKAGVNAIKKAAAIAIKPLPFSGAVKASAIEDIAAQAASFIELTATGQNAGFPDRTDEELDYHAALNDFILSTTLEQADIARNDMSKALREGVRPLSFYKSRVSDGFLILADKKGRMFAYLNLWSAKDKRAEKVTIEMTNTRTGEDMKFTSSTGLLLPLECSPWHQTALQSGQSKSAKLCKIDNEYHLAVSVEYEIEPREVETYLGVDRGIEEIATYAVRKHDGTVIHSGTLSGTVLREHQRKLEIKQKMSQKKGRALVAGWSKYSDHLMHHVANEIVKVANKYNAQVVIEDLSAIKNGHQHTKIKGARKSNFRRLLSRQQYGKLEFMLGYKLQMVGLPKPKQVHAAYTSLTCPRCGHADKTNRPERAIFYCTECKFKEHADIIGGINIAGKRIWLEAVGSKLGKGKALPDSLKFAAWQAENLKI